MHAGVRKGRRGGRREASKRDRVAGDGEEAAGGSAWYAAWGQYEASKAGMLQSKLQEEEDHGDEGYGKITIIF